MQGRRQRGLRACLDAGGARLRLRDLLVRLQAWTHGGIIAALYYLYSWSRKEGGCEGCRGGGAGADSSSISSMDTRPAVSTRPGVDWQRPIATAPKTKQHKQNIQAVRVTLNFALHIAGFQFRQSFQLGHYYAGYVSL